MKQSVWLEHMMYFWGDGMVVGIDEKFLFREKMGVPLIIFFKKLGVPPNHQIFFGSGRPGREKKTIRGTPIFFPEKDSSTPNTTLSLPN